MDGEVMLTKKFSVIINICNNKKANGLVHISSLLNRHSIIEFTKRVSGCCGTDMISRARDPSCIPVT